MVAAVSLLLIVVLLVAFLPLSLSVFAYAFVEARHRPTWSTLVRPPVRLGAGPYRGTDLAPARLQRAPWLVRAAALGCFYWSWFCLVAWVTVGVISTHRPSMELLAFVTVVVAVYVGRAGVRLLRRDARAVAFGRRIAALSAAHATLLVVLGFGLGGADWSAPAAVFGFVSLGQAALLVLALREHGSLFARPGEGAGDPRGLPPWLARMLARHAEKRSHKAPVLI